MTNIEYLTSYVNHFVETIKQAGVQDIVMCPGSRSTPLAYAFAKSEGFQFYRQIDERSAGYFALGIAKAKKSCCTFMYFWDRSCKFLSRYSGSILRSSAFIGRYSRSST